jgi:glycine cleavage system H lipoate-binding protein
VSGLPQYFEAVVGFRAWRPRPDGVLTPWTMTGAPWRPGVNEGRCLVLGGGSRRRRHSVPGHDCTCGLYALTALDDPRLDPLGAVVGSIAAWGEIEVHATGFRARYAAITGLAVDARASVAHRARLAAAARHYDVALVAPAALDRHALGFGRPVDFEAIPPAPSGPPPPHGPSLRDHGLRGIAVDDHVWIEIAPGDALTLGVTAALASEIAICSPILPQALDRAHLSGETLLVIGEGADALLVRSPVDLAGFELNPRIARDPDLVRTDAEGAGWLLRALPLAWEDQAGDVLWGRRAETIYRASVAHAARHEDPFGWCKPAWVERQPRARNAADALAILRAARSPPRFEDARAVEEQIGGRLARVLADAAVRRRALRAGVRLALRLHDPEADLEVDLGGGRGAQPAPTITLYARAETADDFLAGRLDIASALRSRRIQTDAPHTRVLVVASLIKELQRAYRAQD